MNHSIEKRGEENMRREKSKEAESWKKKCLRT